MVVDVKNNFLLPSFIVIWMAAMLFPGKIFSQKDTTRLRYISYNQIKVAFTPVIYNKLKTYNQGTNIIKSSNTFSGVLGLSYSQSIYDFLAVNIGGEITVVPQKIIIPYDDVIFDTITNTFIINNNKKSLLKDITYVHYLYVLSASLERIFIKNSHQFYSVQLGIKYNSLVAYDYIVHMTASKNNRIYFDFYLQNNYQRNFISYFIKAGIIKTSMTKQVLVFKNGELKKERKAKNTVQINLVLNYSPSKIGKGEYKFYSLSDKSYGTVELGLNYIGIEFNLGLTLKRVAAYR